MQLKSPTCTCIHCDGVVSTTRYASPGSTSLQILSNDQVIVAVGFEFDSPYHDSYNSSAEFWLGLFAINVIDPESKKKYKK